MILNIFKQKYYFRQPYDILNTLTMIEKPYINHKWLTTAMEMQFIAQAGLAYTKMILIMNASLDLAKWLLKS